MLLIFGLFSFNLAHAAECVPQGLVQGCTISASMTFNITANSTYNLNGSNSGTKVVSPNANNIVIDCAGVTFIGNYTTGTSETGIRWSRPQGFSNVTYKNCILQSYYNGIGFVNTETSGAVINVTFNNSFQPIDITTGRNILITNSTFQKTDFYGILLEPNSNLWHNITIQTNTFAANTQRAIRATGHTTNRAKGVFIIGNTILNGTSSSSLWVDYTDNVNITDNIVNANQVVVLSSEGIHLNALNNVNVLRNNVSGYDRGISASTDRRFLNATTWTWECGNLTSNVTILNNLVFDNDRGMSLRGLQNATINSNTFLNNTNGVDDYDVGLYLEECNNGILINANNFSQTGSTGIAITNVVNNFAITNNIFDMLNQTEKTALFVNDIFDYPSAISIVEMYKQFAQANRTGYGNPYNYTLVGNLKSNNGTISGNTFDSDTQLYLTLQGAINMSISLPSNWYRKWTPLTYLEDAYEYYVPNAYTRLYWTNSLGTIKDQTSYGWGNTTTVYNLMNSNFTISWEFWKNIDTIPQQLIRYNSTIALFVLSNGTGYVCSNDCNLTLTPNNSTYILDNYNFTEGSTPRINDPIWIVLSNDSVHTKTYHIGSNITNLITIPILLSVNCSRVQSISITPDGSSSYTPVSSCYGNILIITNTDLNPSSNSNIIVINYQTNVSTSCSDTESFFITVIPLIGLLLTIILIAGVIGVLMSHFGVLPDIEIGSNLELSTVMTSVVIISIVGILISFLIYLFESGLCPALGG